MTDQAAAAPATPVGLPAGVRDVLPVEAEELRAIEQAVRARFALYGYREVMTPVIELAAVLDRAQDDAAAAPAYRLFDDRGRVLTLRPDLTIPAARLIATRMPDREGAVRVFYVARAFRPPPPGRPRPAEQRQAGVELVGPAGPEADAEAIGLLVDALAHAGLGRVRIGVADVSLTEAVLSALGVEAPAAARLRAALAARNFVAWGRGVATLGLGEDEARLLAGLPALRGDADVLAKVVEAVPQAAPACERLERVLAIARPQGDEAEVGVDLGVLRDWPYYSGVVFEAYAPGVSEPVAVGGRYDALGARFGTDRAAVGFAIGLDLLHRALAPLARSGAPRQGAVVADGLGAEAETARALRAAGLAAVALDAAADAERLAEEDDWRYVVRRDGPGFAVHDRRSGERFSCGRPEEVLPSRG
jgi:ATP phosphoribosyltransferase regulatory subunit